jgi:hypothetical protein
MRMREDRGGGRHIALASGAAGCRSSAHGTPATTRAAPRGDATVLTYVAAAPSGTKLQVTIPDGANAAEARQLVGTTGQLAFYDWETNVVGPDGRTAPTNQDVTGSQNAGSPRPRRTSRTCRSGRARPANAAHCAASVTGRLAVCCLFRG